VQRSPFAKEFLASNSIAGKFDVWKRELQGDIDREFLLDGIMNGFKLSNLCEDKANVPSVDLNNHTSASTHSKLVEKELLKQLTLGYYVKASVKPTIVSPIGAILKDNASAVRIIHDASRPMGEALNDYSSNQTVKYQTLEDACSLINPGYYLAKVDLKSAYRSVPLHPSEYCMTGIKWKFQRDKFPTYMFDTRLLFGARKGCSIFHRLTQAIKRMMAKRGIETMVVYLDDFLIVMDSYSSCRDAQHILISLLGELGFLVSWQKVLGPSLKLPFLGIVIDSVNCSLSLDEQKLCVLEEKLEDFNRRRRASKQQLQCLAGHLNWACQAVRGGRFFLRRILDLINKLRLSYHKTRLTHAFKLDIKWWLHFLHTFNGVVFMCSTVSQVVHTDACNSGAGMFFNGDWMYLNWHCDFQEAENLHINSKEILAVVIAAERWGKYWANSEVTVCTDSVVAKVVINRGSYRDPYIMSALRYLFWMSVEHNFKLHAIHVPGTLNQLPDAISRLPEPGQLLRLQSLLLNWHHFMTPISNCLCNWKFHMSSGAFQVLKPQLRWWKCNVS